MWFVFALLSAVFAALTSILAKVGIEGVNSNLATAIRTVVVLAMAWGMVFVTNTQGGLTDISKKSWLFLILSGLATGASWLCYYRALQIGEASKVVPIDKLSVVITLVLAFVFLHERFTLQRGKHCRLIELVTEMFRPDKLGSASRQIAELPTAFLNGNAVLLHELVREILKAGSAVQYRRNLSPQGIFYCFKLLLLGRLSGCGEGCVFTVKFLLPTPSCPILGFTDTLLRAVE